MSDEQWVFKRKLRKSTKTSDFKGNWELTEFSKWTGNRVKWVPGSPSSRSWVGIRMIVQDYTGVLLHPTSRTSILPLILPYLLLLEHSSFLTSKCCLLKLLRGSRVGVRSPSVQTVSEKIKSKSIINHQQFEIDTFLRWFSRLVGTHPIIPSIFLEFSLSYQLPQKSPSPTSCLK